MKKFNNFIMLKRYHLNIL